MKNIDKFSLKDDKEILDEQRQSSATYHKYVQKDVAALEQTLDQFAQYKSEYQQLQKVLKELPEHTHYGAMVPVGPLAFFPGQLVHTNEILVLLGDNYFVERSALQAAGIANRREQYVDEKIKQTHKEIRELKSRLAPEQQQALEDDQEVKEMMYNEHGERFVDIKEELKDGDEIEKAIPSVNVRDNKSLEAKRARIIESLRQSNRQGKVSKLGKDEQQVMDFLDQFRSDEEDEEDEAVSADDASEEDVEGDAFSDEDRANAARDDDEDDFNDNLEEPGSTEEETKPKKKGILKTSLFAQQQQAKHKKKKSVSFSTTTTTTSLANQDLLDGAENADKDVERMTNLLSTISTTTTSSSNNTKKKGMIQEIEDSVEQQPLKLGVVEHAPDSSATTNNDIVDTQMHAREIAQTYNRKRFARMSAGKLEGAAEMAEHILEHTPGVKFQDEEEQQKEEEEAEQKKPKMSRFKAQRLGLK